MRVCGNTSWRLRVLVVAVAGKTSAVPYRKRYPLYVTRVSPFACAIKYL